MVFELLLLLLLDSCGTNGRWLECEQEAELLLSLPSVRLSKKVPFPLMAAEQSAGAAGTLDQSGSCRERRREASQSGTSRDREGSELVATGDIMIMEMIIFRQKP